MIEPIGNPPMTFEELNRAIVRTFNLTMRTNCGEEKGRILMRHLECLLEYERGRATQLFAVTKDDKHRP